MKVYKTQAEVDADLVDGNLIVDDDVKFEVSVIIAGNINAGDINAGDIDAGNINAYDINYFAFCTSYRSIKCTSHKARRNNAHSPICLDGKLTIKKATKQVTIDGVCKKFGCDIKIKKDQK